MRINNGATLMIRCPVCGNNVNEYNYTLETAAHFSYENNSCPTFIKVLLAISDGDGDKHSDYNLICPRCHEEVKLDTLIIPDRELLLQYIEETGKGYLYHRY